MTDVKIGPDKQRSLSALSSQGRIDILACLKGGEMSVTAICKALAREQTSVSHDLGNLVDANFVRMKKDGKFRIYELNAEFAEPFLAALVEPAPDSDGHLRAAIERSPVSISVLDGEGRILYVGGGLRGRDRKTDYSFFIGKTVYEILAGDERAAEDYRRAIACGERMTWTIDSAGRMLEVTSTPYHGEDGSVAGIVCVTHDASAQMNELRLRKIKEDESYWRSLAENSPDIIVQIDRQCLVLAVNRPFEGHDRRSMIGAPLYDHFQERFQLAMRNAHAAAFATGKPAVYETSRLENGSVVRYEGRAMPLWNDGRIIALTATYRVLSGGGKK
ncbi:MAG TPA: PAS domain-containing protein [Candidatus Eisenbacteria bacterium]|jgi:PAS domain S-box-containing protein|nr:PAS domain-containing protein [Candidatus Eisenbacteria bacterium]